MKPTWALILCMAVVLIVSMVDLPVVGWEVTLGMLVLIALLDAVWVMRWSTFTITRNVPSTVSIFKRAVVELEVSHPYKARISLNVVDHAPPSLSADEDSFPISVGHGQRVTIGYSIKPTRRGNYAIESVGLLVRSPLSLWWRRIRVPAASAIQVYPDFESLARYLELLIEQRTSVLGLKQMQRRGAGLEFQQLRDYRQGDALNWIDWNATSKRHSLISRDYQDERNQTLIFLLDTGRRLRAKDDAITHFDHVLNAMMLLSYIALRQGDSVAALCFGVHNRWIPPVSGVAAMKNVLNSVFDLDSGPVTSDYVSMAEQLQLRHRKRALVVLLTNIRDEDYELNEALKMLASRHFVVLANLREKALDTFQMQPIHTFQDALASTGASQYVQERSLLQRKCAQNCNLILDSRPEDLHITLSNAYWAIKRAGRL